MLVNRHFFLAIRSRISLHRDQSLINQIDISTSLKRENRRCIHPELVQSWPQKEKYTLREIGGNRLWTRVAGVDPEVDQYSANIWDVFRSIASRSYVDAKFDVAVPWMAQEQRKKEEAREQVKSRVKDTEVLGEFPGLLNHDLIAWRFHVHHKRERIHVRNLLRERGFGGKAADIPEMIEGLRNGELVLLKKPRPETVDLLARQGVRVALTKDAKRHYSNELHWRQERLAMTAEPPEPEKDLQEVAQAPSKRSAGGKRRWQKWREALRSGEIPAYTRFRTVESRRKISEKMKELLSQTQYTTGWLALIPVILDSTLKQCEQKCVK